MQRLSDKWRYFLINTARRESRAPSVGPNRLHPIWGGGASISYHLVALRMRVRRHGITIALLYAPRLAPPIILNETTNQFVPCRMTR